MPGPVTSPNNSHNMGMLTYISIPFQNIKPNKYPTAATHTPSKVDIRQSHKLREWKGQGSRQAG